MTERGLRKGQLKTIDEAKVSSKQHNKPCVDCPWTRTSIPGWLADATPEEWIQFAHTDGHIECHTLLEKKTPIKPWQCAGAAIYRANVCKHPRDKTNLELPKDKELVFGLPQEFLDHHTLRSEK